MSKQPESPTPSADCRTDSDDKFRLDRRELTQSIHRLRNGSREEEVELLRPGTLGPDADTVHRLISQGISSGVVACPGSQEIIVYPSSVEEPWVCVITVWDADASGRAHVVAATCDSHELAATDLWEGDDPDALTEAVIEQIVAIANEVVGDIDAIRKANAHLTTRPPS